MEDVCEGSIPVEGRISTSTAVLFLGEGGGRESMPVVSRARRMVAVGLEEDMKCFLWVGGAVEREGEVVGSPSKC